MGKGFFSKKLCDETFVALLSRDHAIQSDDLSLEQYLVLGGALLQKAIAAGG